VVKRRYVCVCARDCRLITSARKVVQVGLTPVRCADCDGLLCTASTGSVISVICGRCKTHNIVEVKKPIDTETKNPQNR